MSQSTILHFSAIFSSKKAKIFILFTGFPIWDWDIDVGCREFVIQSSCVHSPWLYSFSLIQGHAGFLFLLHRKELQTVQHNDFRINMNFTLLEFLFNKISSLHMLTMCKQSQKNHIWQKRSSAKFFLTFSVFFKNTTIPRNQRERSFLNFSYGNMCFYYLHIKQKGFLRNLLQH